MASSARSLPVRRGPVGGQAVEQPLFDSRPALSISALLGQVRQALAEVFPPGETVWVRGEIQSVTDHRSGHCYIDLVDPDGAGARDAPALKVNCWRSTWVPLKRLLASRGIALHEGMVVTMRGRVELYAPRAQVNFVALELDVDALLGRLAAQRAALLRQLEAEGLLRRNAQLASPALPLVVGLVASPESEGFRDCTGQLLASGFAFRVRHVPVPVQGPSSPAAVAAAVAALDRAGCDVVVVVRGGGARADLAAFDTELVARAVATANVPVWTGIGHTGDQSVADVVAHRSFVTPTECGQELVRQVAAWWQARSDAATCVVRHAQQVAGEAMRRDTAARNRLVACTRSQLRAHGDRLGARAGRLGPAAARSVHAAQHQVTGRAARLGPLAVATLDRQQERAAAWRRLLQAYDVERQLRRGYTLTFDGTGRIVRGSDWLATGDEITTRFADGTVRSVVSTGPATPGNEEET